MAVAACLFVCLLLLLRVSLLVCVSFIQNSARIKTGGIRIGSRAAVFAFRRFYFVACFLAFEFFVDAVSLSASARASGCRARNKAALALTLSGVLARVSCLLQLLRRRGR